MNKLKWGSILVGVGIAGSFDGIVFHQLLQWHSVVMHTDKHGMIFSDGLFHTATTLALIAGAFMLWSAGTKHPKLALVRIVSGILIGSGAFNLLEGLINHHLLQIHHVKQGDPNELMYDLQFLASGLLLIGVGKLVGRKSPKTVKLA